MEFLRPLPRANLSRIKGRTEEQRIFQDGESFRAQSKYQHGYGNLMDHYVYLGKIYRPYCLAPGKWRIKPSAPWLDIRNIIHWTQKREGVHYVVKLTLTHADTTFPEQKFPTVTDYRKFKLLLEACGIPSPPRCKSRSQKLVKWADQAGTDAASHASSSNVAASQTTAPVTPVPQPNTKALTKRSETPATGSKGKHSGQSGDPQASAPDKPVWQPDSKAERCKKCKKAFLFFTWKHHCRACGLIFCGNCTEGEKDKRRCHTCRDAGKDPVLIASEHTR